MYDNQNYPWQYQDTERLKAIYDGLFPIMSNASAETFKNILDIDQMTGEGVFSVARLWNVPIIYGAIVNGFVFDVNEWDDGGLWNGEAGSLDEDFYKKYIKMKIFIHNQPFSLTTIKQALDIWFKDLGYNCEVVEENYSFDVNITLSDLLVQDLFTTILNTDRYIFGKPAGITYTVNLAQE